ncbi:14652_t:CDS:2, partial [Dentiscutata erythropus]
IMVIRRNGLVVTYPSIKLKMAEILDKSIKQTDDVSKKLAINKFKLSTHWLGHFLNHNNLSLRHKTKITQKLPEDLENQLLSFQRWMSNSSNGITKKGNLKHVDLSTICHWVLNAWENVSEDIIIWAFKKCGISNCLLGSEDHLIYENDDNDEKSSDDNELYEDSE